MEMALLMGQLDLEVISIVLGTCHENQASTSFFFPPRNTLGSAQCDWFQKASKINLV